ncbi:MAG: cupin domain-containing protein [Verrucomicrobiota bacterium]|nr:cupin domain-containing protein [Verrucomicrobiota bacterium]
MPENDEGEMLSEYIAHLEKAEGQYKAAFRDQGIVLSTMAKSEPLRQGGITRERILWRLYQYPMAYVVTVPKGQKVPEHFHDEDIFRLLIEGSLFVTVRQKEYKISTGDWFVIREGTPYSIHTPDGYKCIANYVAMCKPGSDVGGASLSAD